MRQQNDTIPPEVLSRNLTRVRSRMAAAAAKVSRNPESIRLVAVTKYTGIETLRTLIGLGVTDIGESRIQDAEKKYAALNGESLATQVQWHLIGHLQTNKADKAVKIFQNIHSVDSLRIAQSLNKEAEKSHRPRLNCLLEVNVAGEANKFGLKPEIAVLSDLLKIATGLPHLRITGLMTMAPFPSPSLSDANGETPERVARPVFRRLRELLEDINAKNLYPEPLIELSMGMTQDFEIAIEEGATSIRIGSALLDE